MKIDVTPVIEQADETDAICIQMREIEALYVVRLANGKNHTTKFSKKELDEFQPSKTVSQMMDEWEKGIVKRHTIAKKAIESGLHPTNTFERPIMMVTPSGHEFNTGKSERIRCELNDYQREYYQKEILDREAEFGKMIFVKIC
jgi:hypothetical protein